MTPSDLVHRIRVIGALVEKIGDNTKVPQMADALLEVRTVVQDTIRATPRAEPRDETIEAVRLVLWSMEQRIDGFVWVKWDAPEDEVQGYLDFIVADINSLDPHVTELEQREERESRPPPVH